jgi:hypothetical protein
MVNRESIIRHLFTLVITVQLSALMVLVLTNLYTLDSVTYTFDMPSGFDDTSGGINFYELIGVIGIVYALVITLSIGVFGIGLNAAGSWTILRWVSSIFGWMVLSLGTAAYLAPFPEYAFAWEFFGIIVFVLFLLERGTGAGDSE